MGKKKILKKSVKIAKSYRNITAILVVAIVSFLGVLLLNNSHASTPYVSTEAESGQLAGNACKQSDTNASGGTFVQFGGTACTPVTPPPTGGVPLLGLWDQGDFDPTNTGITQQLTLIFADPGDNYCQYPTSGGEGLSQDLTPGTTAILSVGACTSAQSTAIAKYLLANGQGSAYIRPMWEMNNDDTNFFQSWNELTYTTPSPYISEWINNIYTPMKAVSSNFKFMWVANGDSNISTAGAGNNAKGRTSIDTYPGDAYVNYIGNDIYDSYGGTVGGTTEFAAFAASHNKPFVIPEWGVNGSGSSYDAGQGKTFMNSMISLIKAPANNVYLQSYFSCPCNIDSSLPGNSPLETIYETAFKGE